MHDDTTIVFGGSFDPPHLAHEAIIRQLLKIRKVARVLVVPSNSPPHKTPILPFWQRVEMCRRAFDDLDDRVRVLDIETFITGTSYTCVMVNMLPPEFAPFTLVLGTDEARSLPYWRSPEIVLEKAEIIIAERPGCKQLTQKEIEAMELPKDAVDVLLRAGRFALSDSLDISSTEVRDMIVKIDRSWKELVHPAVAQYIEDRTLYY